MRMTVLGIALVFVLVLAAGCHSTSNRTLSKQEALSRCGGGLSGSHGAIVAGTENEFFTATSRQSIKIKPGIDIKNVPDPDGKLRTLTLKSSTGSLDMDCRCPSGCGETGDGCIPIVVIGSGDAFCVGDCETDTSCCYGCGWH